MTMSREPTIGTPSPLGAAVRDGGVNFSVFSRRARAAELLLFDGAADPRPARVVRLDPADTGSPGC